jgi:hypothetical protein
MIRGRLLVVLLAFGVAATACTGDPNDGDEGGLDTSFSAVMASTWHYAGAPQRVQIGILASDENGVRPVTQGSVDVSFSFLGAQGGDAPVQGPSATARFLPVPGSAPQGNEPALVTGANGVYEAEDVTFDRPGVWRATVSLAIGGVAREIGADFPVAETSAIPAPGMDAPATETLTMDSKVRPGAIDSMADGGGAIPDPELHRLTIAAALRLHRPILALFGTPAYCESRFCGPEVQALQRLASEHPEAAVYVHVEIWKDFDAQVINKGAADWLLRGSDMTEPWLFLIGPDGVIVDRWGPLFDPAEVADELTAIPPIEG